MRIQRKIGKGFGKSWILSQLLYFIHINPVLLSMLYVCPSLVFVLYKISLEM